MTFTFQPWMKNAFIIVGVVLLIAIIIFLYLLIAGADESRRKDRFKQINHDNEDAESDEKQKT